MLDAARHLQDDAATNRRFDGVGTDVDEPDGFCPGSHDGQSQGGGIADHEISTGTKRTVACVDRQYRPGSLRCRPMAGRKTWREIAPDVAQAASREVLINSG